MVRPNIMVSEVHTMARHTRRVFFSGYNGVQNYKRVTSRHVIPHRLHLMRSRRNVAKFYVKMYFMTWDMAYQVAGQEVPGSIRQRFTGMSGGY